MLLAARHNITGRYLMYKDLCGLGRQHGVPVVPLLAHTLEVHGCSNVAQQLAECESLHDLALLIGTVRLPHSVRHLEGAVIVVDDGQRRIKIKT